MKKLIQTSSKWETESRQMIAAPSTSGGEMSNGTNNNNNNNEHSNLLSPKIPLRLHIEISNYVPGEKCLRMSDPEICSSKIFR